jgi:hypothetical protein
MSNLFQGRTCLTASAGAIRVGLYRDFPLKAGGEGNGKIGFDPAYRVFLLQKFRNFPNIPLVPY